MIFEERAEAFKTELEDLLKKYKVELESDTYDGTFTLEDSLDRKNMILNFQFDNNWKK